MKKKTPQEQIKTSKQAIENLLASNENASNAVRHHRGLIATLTAMLKKRNDDKPSN